MKLYRIADLCSRGFFIMALRRLCFADNVELLFFPERQQHALVFIVEVWGQEWRLQLWLPGFEATEAEVNGAILQGNTMIQDVEAHYRQQAVAR